MRVAVIGRTYLLQANRVKWRYLPSLVEVAFITPAWVPHTLGRYEVEWATESPHYVMRGHWANRSSGFFFSPVSLWQALQDIQPELVQVDEEPSSLALLEVLTFGRRLGYRTIFFTWENLVTRYRFPFNVIRQVNLRQVAGAIAGNREAAALLQAAGFRGPLAVIPQLGVDRERFAPKRNDRLRQKLGLWTFTVGYVGRLVPEKGLWVLLEALSQLKGNWQCLLVGDGPLRDEWLKQAKQRGWEDRIVWHPPVPHREVPDYINAMDVVVLPSLTASRWKEQFGHVIIEAMSCGVPVIGSDSGAIPEIIGEAGIIVPEGDAQALAQAIGRLRSSTAERTTLGQRGRERVLAQYTNERIAQATYLFWQEVMSADSSACQ